MKNTREPNNELPENEEPYGISHKGNLLRPDAPRGTSFNKKTITIIGLTVGLAILFGVVAAFSPSNKSAKQNAMNGQMGETKVSSDNITPDAINGVPSSYAGQDNSHSNYQVPVIPTNDQPVPPSDVNLSGMSTAQQESRDAGKSPTRFASLDQSQYQQKQGQTNTNSSSNPNSFIPPVLSNPPVDQNGQDEKKAFLNSANSTSFYTNSLLTPPLSKYEVKAGSVIPVTLITGINSDLPGYITAQVRENVYDTVSGRFLLIPQGAKLIGIYDSKIAYAQNRLLVAWTRLILPNGKSLALEGMPGADNSGYSGLKDKVNNHIGKIVVGGLLTSLLGAGSKMISSNNSSTPGSYVSPSVSQLAASGAAESLAEAGTKIFEKNLDVQPTVEIAPGLKFNVFVEKDLILETYRVN